MLNRCTGWYKNCAANERRRLQKKHNDKNVGPCQWFYASALQGIESFLLLLLIRDENCLSAGTQDKIYSLHLYKTALDLTWEVNAFICSLATTISLSAWSNFVFHSAADASDLRSLLSILLSWLWAYELLMIFNRGLLYHMS